jgi:hypothetical protein
MAPVNSDTEKKLISIDFNANDERIFDKLSEVKKEETMQFVLNYLKSKDYYFQEVVVLIHTDQIRLNKKYASSYDINSNDSLNNLLKIIQSCLRDTKKEIRSCHSIDEREELDDDCRYYTIEIEFLSDLQKLQKILQRREIALSKRGILEICFSLIQAKRFHYYSKKLEPYLNIWKEKLGENHTIELVFHEINNTKFDFHSDEDTILNKWGYQWVLKQFGYDCDLISIEDKLKPILEKRELDRFEKELTNPSKVKKRELNITDFSKISGYDFEHFIANLFKNLGYKVNITPKSRDQGADIILNSDDDITAVQVKNYTQLVSNSAIQEVVAAKKYYHCNKAMVVTSSFFTPSAIDLAYANDVILWDGDKLKQILTENQVKKK